MASTCLTGPSGPVAPCRRPAEPRKAFSLVAGAPLEVDDLGERALEGAELHRQLDELALEGERHLVVPVVDRRARVDAHVEGLVLREEEGQRLGHPLVVDDVAVDLEPATSAEPEPDPVVREVVHEGVLARGQRVLTLPPDTLQVDVVVNEHRLALEKVEAEAAEPAAV